jgi:uncharacterized membrane protein
MFSFKKNSVLFTFGGIMYGLIEILWRGKTHWSMVLTGGACFLSLFKVFGKLKSSPLWEKCLLGSSIITAYEFVSGCLFNLWLKLKVWDYSSLPLNFKGQICALYSFLWGLLCIPINHICKRLSG